MDVTDRVATSLACSAVDPRLAGLLFFDLDPALVYPLARWLADLLGEEPRTRIIPIGPRMTEERLWQRFELDRDTAEHPEDRGFAWVAGPLAGYERAPGIVVVSDLALAGLPATRAAVTLIGAEVAHLERSGVSRTWHPRDRWLATLRRQDVGSVSPHVLDRFAVRIDAQWLRALQGGGPVLPPAEHRWKLAVQAVQEGAELPPLSAAAVERVLSVSPPRAHGTRRDLALARVARALAMLAATPQVLPDHVDSAAELAGLRIPAGPPFPGLPGPGQGAANGISPHGAAESTKVPIGSAATGAAANGGHAGGPVAPAARGPAVPGPAQLNGVNGHLSNVPGGDPQPLPPDLARDDGGEDEGAPGQPAGTYPEDEAAPGRDVAPLRIGWQRALTGPPRGHPIGTRRTWDNRDIAVAATLLNAAQYQRLRCPRHFEQGHRLHVLRADLLSYRRAPYPGHLLVLLLDHTCRAQDWDWYQPLAPYLRQGYVARAPVGVVEVGARADTRDGELRATQFRSRSLLDPRVADALDRQPGRATPLAHGLTMAAAMLRHYTQQGTGLPGSATLIVITDGRANVPLAASQAGRLAGNLVGGTAVSDAEDAARKISALRRVRRVVIDPGLQPYRHLAAKLAVALGATLVDGTSPPAADIPEAESLALADGVA